MWEDEAPDPDEDDISQWTPTRRLRGTSMFTISASTIRRPAGRDFPVEDPDIAEVVSDFETLLTNIVGAQPDQNLFGNIDYLFQHQRLVILEIRSNPIGIGRPRQARRHHEQRSRAKYRRAIEIHPGTPWLPRLKWSFSKNFR